MNTNTCTVWYVVCLQSDGQASISESPAFVQVRKGAEVKYCTRDLGYAMRVSSMLATSKGKLANAPTLQPTVNRQGRPVGQVRFLNA